MVWALRCRIVRRLDQVVVLGASVEVAEGADEVFGGAATAPGITARHTCALTCSMSSRMSEGVISSSRRSAQWSRMRFH